MIVYRKQTFITWNASGTTLDNEAHVVSHQYEVDVPFWIPDSDICNIYGSPVYRDGGDLIISEQ